MAAQQLTKAMVDRPEKSSSRRRVSARSTSSWRRGPLHLDLGWGAQRHQINVPASSVWSGSNTKLPRSQWSGCVSLRASQPCAGVRILPSADLRRGCTCKVIALPTCTCFGKSGSLMSGPLSPPPSLWVRAGGSDPSASGNAAKLHLAIKDHAQRAAKQ